MNNITVSVVTLGCNKNLVDSEYMLGYLEKAGFSITTEEAGADVIIVNTCGFIEAAKTEAVNALFSAIKHKNGRCRAVLAAGCLATRYPEELAGQIPELDGILGVYDIPKVAEIVRQALGLGIETEAEKAKKPIEVSGSIGYLDGINPRVLSTAPWMAYLKIAEGCSNRCAYCAIPGIRGPFHSRREEVLLQEAQALRDRGVQELLVTAQDSTRYGEDEGENRFIALLEKLSRMGFPWIRILYAYPSRVSPQLLEFMESTPNICKYIDMPIQHTETAVLHAMKRTYGQEEIVRIMEKIRSFSDWGVRTTILTGFPGEKKKDFENMLAFLRAYPFEHLGAFAYSREEGTAAAALRQISAAEKEVRMDSVMLAQGEISHRLLNARVGREYGFLAEGYNKEHKATVGRIALQAPETDGQTFVFGPPLKPGTFSKVRITDAFGYDLYAEAVTAKGEGK